MDAVGLTKTCPLCGAAKSLGEFPKQKSRRDGHAAWCKPCHAAKSRAWRQNNTEKAREAVRRWRERNPTGHRRPHLRRRYGIELEAYEALFAAQRGRCAICGRRDSDVVKKVLCVDHVAGTSLIRGLLCSRCNSAIGLLDHDPERLGRAIDYLGRLPVMEGKHVARGVHRSKRRTRTLPPTCRQGHEYTADNLRLTRNGWRRCRECERERYARQKTERKAG